MPKRLDVASEGFAQEVFGLSQRQPTTENSPATATPRRLPAWGPRFIAGIGSSDPISEMLGYYQPSAHAD